MIELFYNGATIRKPATYSRSFVLQSGGTPLTGASTVGIVGEAVGGEPGSTAGYVEYESSQIADLIETYISGPIVEAARALVAPARDNRVVNGASFIKVYKTNNSAQATKTLQNISATTSDIFTLTSQNYGLNENLIYFYITEGSIADTECNISSSAITFPVTMTLGDTLILVIGGVTYTYTVAASAGAKADVAAVLSALNTSGEWSPSKPVIASAGTVSNTVKLTLDPTNAALDEYNQRKEYAILERVKSTVITTNLAYILKFTSKIDFATSGTSAGTFTVASSTGLTVGQYVTIADSDTTEITSIVTDITGSGPYTVEVDLGNTDLSAYTTGNSAAVYIGGSKIDFTTLAVTNGSAGPVRGSIGSRIFTIGRNTDVEILEENDSNVMLRLWYAGAGTNCTMSILDVSSVKKLQTTVTGGPGGENLDIILQDYTIAELCDYINGISGTPYIAYAVYGNKEGQTCEVLDYYDVINISKMPLEIKATRWEIETIVNQQSKFVTIEIESNKYGQLETISSTAKEFLAGGTRGYSTNTSFQDGFDALLYTRCNTVLPLISRDATSDIADGLTDASSTYTIDSVNLIADTHCRTASSTTNRSERNCYVSELNTSFSAVRSSAESLNSEYTSFCIQEVLALDYTGTLTWMQPYILAAMCAGMQSGMEVGSPITYKQPNIYGIRHDEFNPNTQYNQAIKSGILYVEEPDSGGFRIAVGNTTYGKDSNSVYNRISTLACAHYVAYNLRQQLDSIYVGTKFASAESTGESIVTTIIALMTSFKDAGIIVGDDTNNGLGYKGLSVRVSGNVVYVDITITPAPGIDFILATISIDTVRATL